MALPWYIFDISQTKKKPELLPVRHFSVTEKVPACVAESGNSPTVFGRLVRWFALCFCSGLVNNTGDHKPNPNCSLGTLNDFTRDVMATVIWILSKVISCCTYCTWQASCLITVIMCGARKEHISLANTFWMLYIADCQIFSGCWDLNSTWKFEVYINWAQILLMKSLRLINIFCSVMTNIQNALRL